MLGTFLNGVIRVSLQNRMVVAAMATLLLLYGGWSITRLSIDVFPNLNRPRVVVMTEAPGMAPEEVETLITLPLETALNGAAGVQVVRSSSGVGISIVYVEFDWGTDIYTDRQVVAERLALAEAQLPAGIKPQLAPISSIMGQIMIAGIYSQPNQRTLRFSASREDVGPLADGPATDRLRQLYRQQGIPLSSEALLEARSGGGRLWDPATDSAFALVEAAGEVQIHSVTSPMQLRTLADWVVRQQLLTIPGVSQVFVMGGERKQFQVLVDPGLMLRYGVTWEELETALGESNQNATGGYLDEQGPSEYLVRGLGRIQSVDDLKGVVVTHRSGRPITVGQVARVATGAQVQRGDSTAYRRDATGRVSGGPAVALTINKQPGADTREVTRAIRGELTRLQQRLPPDVVIAPDLYQQSTFIDLAIANVMEALRDGGLLVVIVLFVFLLNFRTTFITLTAIPLSLVVTGVVFQLFQLSINTMTLGGLAVAIGELVDDAIVDVENIYRRLRENRLADSPKPALQVVFQASVEIRNSIVFGTMIVVLVFLPLFALEGMEGRLFAPLGVAYIVSILSSLAVSLTVTPVLSYWLLGRQAADSEHASGRPPRDGLVLRQLKAAAAGLVGLSLRCAAPILVVAAAAVALAAAAAWNLENDFLPPFDEGTVQINVLMPPGTSLRESQRVAEVVDQRLMEIEAIQSLVRKTGRAELDEHAEGVNVSELVACIDADAGTSREALLEQIRDTLADIPGLVISVEQPLAHLISHMLSGVKAQVAIKLYGDDLDRLRRTADEIKREIESVKGVKDLQVEPQVLIPQLRIEVDGYRLQQFGLRRGEITELIELAMNGRVISEVVNAQRKFDLLLRLDEPFREDIETLKRLRVPLPSGGDTSLESVANVYPAFGPNTINREQVRRRVVIQCNVGERGLVDVVEEIQARLAPLEAALPESYFLAYAGQFQSQRSASRRIAILFALALAGMLLLLTTMFRSVNLALQVMVALPAAFIGSVAALVFTGQTLTVASMVGFISLCGIASRNGILLINHYLHLVQVEGEAWSPGLLVRAGQERVAPVLMTALTSGIGLIPLALAAGEPGKEILYPVATVIIGGLVTSTLLEFLVRPALFWLTGVPAAQRARDAREDPVQLMRSSPKPS